MVALDASNLESAFEDASITKYELGSSLVVTEGGAYHVDMQAFKTTTQSSGASIVSKSRSVGSVECVVPHAAIPAVTLKVAGLTPTEGNYVIEDEDIAGQYTFIDETNSPSVKAIITKDETNVISRTSMNSVKVSINKLIEAPDDLNKVVSQENQDSISVVQNGNNAIIIGHIDALNVFASTNSAQGEAKWIGLDIGVNVNDITELTWNGFALSADDVAEAASVGLGDGHIVFWAKAEQLPRVIRIGREGYGEAEVKVSFVEVEDYVPAADDTIDAEKALANARKGIIKESSLGKIGFAMVGEDEEPDFSGVASEDLVKYDSASEFDIASNNASIEGLYCVYAVNERNHTRSVSKPSNIINVSKVAPSLVMDVIGTYNNQSKSLIVENEAQGINISMEGSYGYKCDLLVDIANFGSFIDPVEIQLNAIEIFAENTPGDPQPDIYPISKDDNDKYTFSIRESGNFIIRATTYYHGTKRITETAPFVITWDK